MHQKDADRLAKTSLELYGDLQDFTIGFETTQEAEEAMRAYERLGCVVEREGQGKFLHVFVRSNDATHPRAQARPATDHPSSPSERP